MRYAKQIATVTYVDAFTLCDLCGENTHQTQHGNACGVEIRADIGDYFEGDMRVTTRVDCCPTCWLTRVLPTLRALGFTFREHDTDEGDTRPIVPGAAEQKP